MDRLWTDGPPTQTYTPPQPPQPPYAAPPAYPPPPPPPRDRGRWVAAFGGGTVSAVVVAEEAPVSVTVAPAPKLAGVMPPERVHVGAAPEVASTSTMLRL